MLVKTMNLRIVRRTLTRTVAVTLWLVLVAASAAQTVWNGPSFTFTKADGDDWTLEAHQDRITPQVWLTRGALAGLFNIAVEPAYDLGTRLSPLDTEWAFAGLNGNATTGVEAANHASLTFAAWAASLDDFPPEGVGRPAVLHLISEGIYLDITFNAWSVGAGGFSYTRSTVPEPASVYAVSGLLCFGLALWRCCGTRGCADRPPSRAAVRGDTPPRSW